MRCQQAWGARTMSARSGPISSIPQPSQLAPGGGIAPSVVSSGGVLLAAGTVWLAGRWDGGDCCPEVEGARDSVCSHAGTAGAHEGPFSASEETLHSHAGSS